MEARELLEEPSELELELELEVKNAEVNSSDPMETKVTWPTCDNLHDKKKPWVEEMEERDRHLLITITTLVHQNS